MAIVKLGAVFILTLSLAGFANYLIYLNTLVITFLSVTGFLCTLVLPILIAAVIWRFPSTVLGKLEPSQPPSQRDQDFILLGVTLIGLYALVFGIVDLMYFEALRVAEREAMDPNRTGLFSPTPHVVAGRYTNILQSAIGLVLLLGKEAIARFLRTARSAT